MFGNWGQVLEVNLTTKQSQIQVLDREVYARTIGGSGLASQLIYDRLSGDVDPLSPENILIFATGPFQGTSFPGSAKWMAVSKSPLTGTICISGAGASFGPALKKTGFDAIIITGRSPEPVYLVVHEKGATIRDARSLWGKDALETVDFLAQEWSDRNPGVVAIGPAGEKQVAIACLVADGHSFAGRGGLGAVMGAKRLKAVLAIGNRRPPVADPERLTKLTQVAARKLYTATKDTYRKHGTANDVVFFESMGDMPIKYWTGEKWPEGARKIGAPRFTKVLSAVPNPCLSCPIGCHRHIDLTTRDGKHIVGPGPEYESLGLLGGACLVDDLEAIAVANDRCNRLGIDTISAGAFVAFAMECREKGLLSRSEISGLSLEWSDPHSLITLIEQIGTATGFGAIFARGIRAAAAEIGEAALSLPVEVKGMDVPAHDPRSFFSLAINYATSPQGACHLRGFPHCGEVGMVIPEVGYNEVSERFTLEGKAWLTKLFQDYAVVLDSLVDCCFMQINGLSLTETVEALNAITGETYDPESLMEVGERVFNLQRLINLRDGLTKNDDRLPARLLEPAKTGPRAGRAPIGYERALQEYYALRGWSEEGVPTREVLKKLNII